MFTMDLQKIDPNKFDMEYVRRLASFTQRTSALVELHMFAQGFPFPSHVSSVLPSAHDPSVREGQHCQKGVSENGRLYWPKQVVENRDSWARRQV